MQTRELAVEHQFGRRSLGAFVGRVRESARLEEALQAGERLITIFSPSGMGKTRLVKEVVHRAAIRFGDRSWFCSLAASRTKDDLLDAVSRGTQLPPGWPSLDAWLAKLLSRGEGLLILDNAEHLEPEARAVVQDWLDRAPGLRILITSLAPLELEGEFRFELGPMDLESAVELFEGRAKRVWPGRVFSSGERQSIVDLVQHLDCFPLAIELAAARMKALGPEAMLAWLGDRFHFLRGTGQRRATSLERALRGSWDLLEAEEQRALALVSVFVGGFTDVAAGALLEEPSGPRESARTIDLLEGLCTKALLQRDETDPSRFTLYESVQAFAAAQLAEQGGDADASDRHAAYFLSFADHWIPRIEGMDGREAIARLLAERDNLLGVFRRLEQADPGRAAAAALAVCIVSTRMGMPLAERGLIDQTIETARRAGDSLLLARVLRCRSSTLRHNGRFPQLHADLDEALALVQTADSPGLEGLLWIDAAWIRIQAGKVDEAAKFLERARVLGKQVEDPMLLGNTQMALGWLEQSHGALEEALTHFREALGLYRACGNLQHQGRSLLRIGWVALSMGDFGVARDAAQDALYTFGLALDACAEEDARLALGCIEREAGRLEEAERHLLESLQMQRQFGNERFIGSVLWNLGLVAMERNEFPLAWTRLVGALEILRKMGDDTQAQQLRPLLAAIRAVRGELDDADTEFAEIRRSSEGAPGALAVLDVLEAFLDLAKARVAAQELRVEEAEAFCQRAASRLEVPTHPRNASIQLRSVLRIVRLVVDRYEGARLQENEASETKAAPLAPRGRDPIHLLVGPGGAWFEAPAGPRVRLGARSAKRRLLQALVDSRLLAPGLALSVDQLLEVGWPGSEALPPTAVNRVYSAVNEMRRAGLEAVLLRTAEGYLLSPEAVITRE